MGRHKRKIPVKGAAILDLVVTIQEAAQIAWVKPETIKYHINHGNISFRETNHVYLIYLPSLLQYYNIADLHQQNS